MSNKAKWCAGGVFLSALLTVATLSSIRSIDIVANKNEGAVASRYHLRTRTSSFFERSKTSSPSVKKAAVKKGR